MNDLLFAMVVLIRTNLSRKKKNDKLVLIAYFHTELNDYLRIFKTFIQWINFKISHAS